MRSVQALALAAARRTPWRNARGFTDELALEPRGSSLERGDFHWRISRAKVAENGAFSSFPGCERILVLLDGGALSLDHGEHGPRARVRTLEPYRFSGHWHTQAQLLGEPANDFNVIYRPELVRADVEVLRVGTRRARLSLDASIAFLHLPRGCALARVTGEEEALALTSGDSLSMSKLAPGDELELLGERDDTLALLVRIEPRSSDHGST
ncbi:MAG: HutD family protein [Planctomycetes bacterium]|nr:HutD family protein [Planctomycetota bacterium]